MNILGIHGGVTVHQPQYQYRERIYSPQPTELEAAMKLIAITEKSPNIQIFIMMTKTCTI